MTRMTRIMSTVLGGIGLVAVLALAACGGTAQGTAGSTSPTATTAPPAVVHTGQATVNGQSETVLTDTRGLTLYFFTPDTSTQIVCMGSCAKAWPPLTATTDTPTANTPLSVKFGVSAC